MEALGLELEEFFKRFLELLHGIPDAYTFNRVFSMVEPAQLIDRKTIRGSASKEKKVVPMVSLWFGAEQMVRGQQAQEENSTEITAISEPLNQIEKKGDTIPIEAMGCQTALVEKIRKKQAHYVLSVKAIQPGISNDIQGYFALVEENWERNPPLDVWRSGAEKRTTVRIENHEALTEENLDWLSGKR
jgi:predicted transposase YbfD/YdcC